MFSFTKLESKLLPGKEPGNGIPSYPNLMEKRKFLLRTINNLRKLEKTISEARNNALNDIEIISL